MNYYRGVLVSVDEGKAKLTRSDNGEEVIIDEAKLCWYVNLFEVCLGCKPFREKIFHMDISILSEPELSPDSESGLENFIRPTYASA